MKFAIWTSVALALASVAGILLQEFLPVRNEVEARALALRLPGPVYRVFIAFQLYDVFRSLWFRALLGGLAASLAVCSAKRFRSALCRATQLHAFREPHSLLSLQHAASVHHASPELVDAVVARLRRRLYSGKVERRDDEILAALHQGGLSRMGPVLLHLGILALVMGGLASSIVGHRSFLEIAPGESAPIPRSRYAVRVDDFQIEKSPSGMIKQYRSKIALLRDEREVAKREIWVNSPLRHAGFNVYQASYSVDPTRATGLMFDVQPLAESQAAAVDPHAAAEDPSAGPVRGSDPQTAAASPRASAGMPAGQVPSVHSLQADLEHSFPVPGFPGYEFRVARFFGHLMIGETGPVNAGRDFDNPAALLDIAFRGQPAGQQWAFARFPGHSRGPLPFTLEMRDAQPVLVTGLEINTNPGAPLVWFGFGLSTLGLVLAFLLQHRCVFLLARPAERGWNLWIAGRSDRQRIAFGGEFERLLAGVREDARRLRQASRMPGVRSESDSGTESSNAEVLVSPLA